jgi:hypothetical protein
VVRGNVQEGDVVAGVPAKRVGRLDMSVAMLKSRNEQFPWRALIEHRGAEHDPAMEEELVRMRVEYFYGKSGAAPASPAAPTPSAPTPPAEAKSGQLTPAES